ncbi:MAG: adenosine deaminase [Bacteroidia bacterium]|jgi:adenosine deaminase
MSVSIKKFIEGLPKAELHLHIEGSFEPELMFKIAQRNQKKIRFNSVEEVKKAYNFSNLQDFLDIYYEGMNVLTTEQDYYDLTWAYVSKVYLENVIHTEIMFDPQGHTDRGIEFDTVINGIDRALKDAQSKLGMTTVLIMSFLRHLDEESAFKTLEDGLRHQDKIAAIGLDSSELGNPPSKFERVYKKAKEAGFKLVAHAGEEGPAEYVWEALNLLNIDRLDHGNRCLEDEELVKELVKRKMGLTVCPLSNLKLCVIDDLKEHPMRTLLEKGLKPSINSDDPAYFGGYMNANYLATAEALNLTKEELAEIAKISFETSFLPESQKAECIQAVDGYLKANS